MINFVWKLSRFLHLNLLHGNDKSSLNRFKLFAVTFIKALQKEINKDIASKKTTAVNKIKCPCHISTAHTALLYPFTGQC